MPSKSVNQFIQQCEQSSQAAYLEFKGLLTELETPETRPNALLFLKKLVEHYQLHKPSGCHFQILQQNVLDANDTTLSLALFQFPSTFLPEAWSFTFYEGLLRYPLADYHQKQVVELGCGIGWISIALALRYGTGRIVGLDINPKAIVCAKLNLYLNAYDENGELRILNNGQSLLDSVCFAESNLLSHFASDTACFDKIIGCIPQVLNPEPAVMENLIAENASDEYLHSLSNYFAKQGYIEDQFGLGLIASAVEQSISLLKTNGKLILNLGGRPGRTVLERLMQRRGFEVRRVWQTQVEQAADTEIDALVDIEQSTGHRFEFYMSANSTVPIDATTAQAFANAGGKIYHSVDVYEAKMLFPDEVKSIFQSVDLLGGKSLRSAIDLTYDNFEDAEERYSFLAFLARQLKIMSQFPYQNTAGLKYFRQQIAEYFGYYLKVDIAESNIVVAPGRREVLASLQQNYQPELIFIEKQLAKILPSSYPKSAQVLHTPAQVEYLTELIGELTPQLIITRIEQYEIQSVHLIAQLIQSAIKANTLLVIDLSDSIELNSEPKLHGIYRYLNQFGMPDNLILMASLVNNRVYQNYSLNFTLTNNAELTKHLVDSAELTYSRTPLLKQMYYAHLLEQMLYFQRTRQILSEPAQQIKGANRLALSKSATAAYQHPAIQGNHLKFDNNTIRLDFGENELAAPHLLKQVIFESYLVRKWVGDEASAEQPIRELLNLRFSLPQSIYSPMVFGNGVAPIYSALLNLCEAEQQALVIPSGSYGYFSAAATYKNISVIPLQTDEANSFKITPEALENCLSKNPKSWLFLNGPTINPTGAVYSSEELNHLFAIAAHYQATVILDSIFTGLEFNGESDWDLADGIQQVLSTRNSRLVLIGGVSKEFSAGGLRFGYCWSTCVSLAQRLKLELPHQPHFTLQYAFRKLFIEQLNGQPELIGHLNEQRQLLKKRAEQLGKLLSTKGWKVIPPQGGLFLVAKPVAFIKESQLNPTEAGDKMTQLLFEKINLVVNNSTWTGLPGYCRFVLSATHADFEQALRRIEAL
ncbi:aminotransferase class I/II-fold pyridoxal phosphate-dependent enzyme [Aliikangiella sp. IMCC44653]